MFQNLGRAIAQLRELKGFSQAALAKQAGIGKSQLSKYEGGKEHPKFDSLEKILYALRVSPHQFFYLFYLVDTSASMLAKDTEGWSGDTLTRPLLLSGTTDEALFQVFADCVTLARCIFEEQVSGKPREGKRQK